MSMNLFQDDYLLNKCGYLLTFERIICEKSVLLY